METEATRRLIDMDKITRAKIKLVALHPFWSVFALRQEVQVRDIQGDIATDGKILALSPEFIKSSSDEELAAGIAKAAAHVALGHHTRKGTRDAQDWQHAAHAAAVNVLREIPYWKGKSDGSYEGMSTEDIYQLIHRKKPEKDQNQEGPQGKPGSDGQGNGKPQEGQGQGQEGPQVELIEPENPQEADQERKQLLRIAARAEASRHAGNIPLGLRKMIQAEEAPAVNWRDELASMATAPAKVDYLWTRPNRRHIADGLYLPSIGGVELSPLVIGIDVSGSTGPYIPAFIAAVEDIMQQHPGLMVHIITCNTKIQESQTFEDAPIKRDWYCGGGTRLKPLMDACAAWTAEDGRTPAGIVVLTDLYSDDIKQLEEPEIPLLWLNYGNHAAPFGRTVHVPVEDAKVN